MLRHMPNKKVMSLKMAQHLSGKRADPNVWTFHEDYGLCEITGLLHHVNDILVSFPHCRFTNEELKYIGVWCEDAAYLSEEGYAVIYDHVVEAGLGAQFYRRACMTHAELIEDQKQTALEKGWKFDG
jgi:hypothetical protein